MANGFQNCVILDSNKTHGGHYENKRMFQNCVILDSNKTIGISYQKIYTFQNCVILDSNKTKQLDNSITQQVLELCYFRQ